MPGSHAPPLRRTYPSFKELEQRRQKHTKNEKKWKRKKEKITKNQKTMHNLSIICVSRYPKVDLWEVLEHRSSSTNSVRALEEIFLSSNKNVVQWYCFSVVTSAGLSRLTPWPPYTWLFPPSLPPFLQNAYLSWHFPHILYQGISNCLQFRFITVSAVLIWKATCTLFSDLLDVQAALFV